MADSIESSMLPTKLVKSREISNSGRNHAPAKSGSLMSVIKNGDRRQDDVGSLR